MNCLGCSACVAVCPVVASDGKYTGPKVLGPSLVRHQEGGWPGEAPLSAEEVQRLGAGLCLGCHRCDLACPAGLAVSTSVRQAKALVGLQPAGASRRFRERLLRNQERLGRLAALAGGPRRLLRRVGPRLARSVDRKISGTLGLSPLRALPLAQGPSFGPWLDRTRDPVAERGRPPVLLFAGCHARFHGPNVGRATAQVLRAAGYRVVVPSQVCCGSPALSQGDEETAAGSSEANLRFLSLASERYGGGVPIVSPCPSCTLALSQTLPELVRGEKAARLAGQTWDLGEFLAGPARPGLLRAIDSASPVPTASRWVYHTPCHLRALGVGRPMTALLALVAGPAAALSAGPASDGCCGMGGLNGLTREGHPASLATGSPVLEAYKALPAAPSAPVVLSDCPACRWQISDATGLAVAHPVERLVLRLRPALCSRPVSRRRPD